MEQPIPCVATMETTMGATVMDDVAMEAWAVAMAASRAVASTDWTVAMDMASTLSVVVAMDAALAMALALATIIEDAVEDTHPLYQDIRIHHF